MITWRSQEETVLSLPSDLQVCVRVAQLSWPYYVSRLMLNVADLWGGRLREQVGG